MNLNSYEVAEVTSRIRWLGREYEEAKEEEDVCSMDKISLEAKEEVIAMLLKMARKEPRTDRYVFDDLISAWREIV